MSTTQRRSVASQIKLASVFVALVLLVLFIALNFGDTEVELVITQVKTKLAFALIFAGLLGFVIGYFAPKRRPF